MRVAGIDYSSHAIDVVLVHQDDLEPPVWHRHELAADGLAFDRTRLVRDWRLPSADDVLAVGIEDPRGQNSGALYRVQGAILARLPADVLVVPWIPSQWRKYVGLAGNCTKLGVALGAVALGAPEEWVTPDSYDAYCIAYATRAALTLAETA